MIHLVLQPFHPYEQGAFQQIRLWLLFSKVQQTPQDGPPYKTQYNEYNCQSIFIFST